MLNIKFEKFKKTHKKKINQVLYYELKSNNSGEVENLINSFLQDKTLIEVYAKKRLLCR